MTNMQKQTGTVPNKNKLKFKSLLLFELKHDPGLIAKTLAAVMIILALIAVHNNTQDYKLLLNQEKEFKKIEDLKVSKYVNYRLYGIYGIRIAFRPLPISILFNQTAVLPEITASMDSGDRLKVYYSFQGKNVFLLKKNNFSDFAGVILFFGTLLALFYGYDGFNKKEYLQFLANNSKPKVVYFAIFIARFLKLALLYLVLLTSAVGVAYLNGIDIPLDGQLALVYALMLLHSLFFFTLGSCFMTIKSKVTGFIVILICWFFSLFFLPNLVHSIVARNADDIITTNDLEAKKLDVISEFEKKILNNQGPASSTKPITTQTKEMIKQYLSTALMDILALDSAQNIQTQKTITSFHKMAFYLPTTFFISVTDEISSLGYTNLIEFNDYIIKRKENFVHYILNKVYFENFSKVVPFEDGKSNVFVGKSRLPGFFLPGILINLLYIAVLLAVAYSRFKVLLFRLPIVSENVPGNHREIHLQPGMYKEWVKEGRQLKNRLYTQLAGETREIKKRGELFKMTVRDIDLTMLDGGIDFLYVCHPGHLPTTIKAGNLLTLMCPVKQTAGQEIESIKEVFGLEPVLKLKLGKLTAEQMGNLWLAILHLRQAVIYLLDDITRDMPVDFHIRLKAKIDDLIRHDNIVLLLITDPLPATGRQMESEFFEANTWAALVERFKKHNERPGVKVGGKEDK